MNKESMNVLSAAQENEEKKKLIQRKKMSD